MAMDKRCCFFSWCARFEPVAKCIGTLLVFVVILLVLVRLAEPRLAIEQEGIDAAAGKVATVHFLSVCFVNVSGELEGLE